MMRNTAVNQARPFVDEDRERIMRAMPAAARGPGLEAVRSRVCRWSMPATFLAVAASRNGTWSRQGRCAARRDRSVYPPSWSSRKRCWRHSLQLGANVIGLPFQGDAKCSAQPRSNRVQFGIRNRFAASASGIAEVNGAAGQREAIDGMGCPIRCRGDLRTSRNADRALAVIGAVLGLYLTGIHEGGAAEQAPAGCQLAERIDLDAAIAVFAVDQNRIGNGGFGMLICAGCEMS